jgi:type I restriction enzyme S subunit
LTPDVTQQIEAGCDGAKMPRADWEHVGSIPMPLPPRDEQSAITAALDRETARIDALVAKKTRFIELLKEKRQALITHAVTKGLDPNVKMKDSGVEWIGEVPEHWRTMKVSFLAHKIGSGKTPSGGANVYTESGVIFLRSQNIYDDGIRLADVAFISTQIDEEMSNSRVMASDVLLNITGASIGRCALTPSDFPPANVNQHVCIMRLANDVIARWIHTSFCGKATKDQVDVLQSGAGREGLNFEQVGNIRVALPPTEEIDGILDTLGNQTVRIDTLVSKSEGSISLLRERRSALITAAVTGQIDLRDGTSASLETLA